MMKKIVNSIRNFFAPVTSAMSKIASPIGRVFGKVFGKLKNIENINQLTKKIVVDKKIGFSSTFFLVFIGPLLATFILFMFSVVGHNQPDSWVNWILAVVFIPTIILSLIVSQKKELIGSYGETILLLIPTFVWLLPGHVDAKNYIVYAGFAVIVLGLVFIFSASLISALRHNTANSKRMKVTEILLRLGFTAVAISSTLIVSIVLINWGDFSLHLADVKQGEIVITTTQDYTAGPWITFIAAVTIFVALTLVMLGLLTGYKKKYVETINDKELGVVGTYTRKPTNDKNLEKTMMINLKKANKKKK